MVLNDGVFGNDGLIEARAGGQVIVSTNATLTNNGQIRGGGTFTATTLSITDTGSLLPGDSANANGTGASTVGLLSITGGLTLANNTSLQFQLGAPGVVGAGTAYDTVAASGALTLDGVLNVADLPGFGPGLYRLFTFAPNTLTDNSLSMGTLPGGYTYNLLPNAAAGTFDLQVVPEPATLGVMGLLALAGLSRRRR